VFSSAVALLAAVLSSLGIEKMHFQPFSTSPFRTLLRESLAVPPSSRLRITLRITGNDLAVPYFLVP